MLEEAMVAGGHRCVNPKDIERDAMAFVEPQHLTTATGDKFTIRTGQLEDAAAMLAYIRPVAEETEFFTLEPDEFPPTEEEERPWVQDHLDSPGKILLLAEASGYIIGSVNFENGLYRRIAHRGYLGIAVIKQWRGQGVGTALLQMLLQWASTNPLIDKVSLDVFATNHGAIRLYKKLGFIGEGLRLKDIKLGPGRYVDSVVMYRFVK
jgi:RimJ/RimL family protein N-acetyltransferase